MDDIVGVLGLVRQPCRLEGGRLVAEDGGLRCVGAGGIEDCRARRGRAVDDGVIIADEESAGLEHAATGVGVDVAVDVAVESSPSLSVAAGDGGGVGSLGGDGDARPDSEERGWR